MKNKEDYLFPFWTQASSRQRLPGGIYPRMESMYRGTLNLINYLPKIFVFTWLEYWIYGMPHGKEHPTCIKILFCTSWFMTSALSVILSAFGIKVVIKLLYNATNQSVLLISLFQGQFDNFSFVI